MGLIRRGLDFLGGILGAEAERDLVVRKDAPTTLASPNFGAIEQMFFATPFTGWSHLLGGVPFPYKQHVWVYACVNAKARNIASVPLNFYSGTKKNKRLIETGPLVKLFETPNPMMSGYQLLEATMIYMGITGESFYVLDRPDITKLPTEIWPFPSSRFEHVPGENGAIKGWLYRKGSKTIPLAPHEVVFMRYFNPYDDYRGLSPVTVASLGIEQDYYAAQYNANFFKNGAQLGGFLETDENLMQEEFDRILNQFNDRHQGVNKAHQIGLLEGGLKYKEAALSQRDMDFLEGRKYNRDEILAVYKVPKGELGIEDDTGSYAKDKVRRKLFWETCLDPDMTMIEFALWSQLCRGLAGPEIWPEFDRKSVPALQEDRGLLIDQMDKLCSRGVPLNVANQYLDLGLPTIEGGDTGYLPFNLTPINEAGAAAPPPPTAAALPPVPKGLPAPITRNAKTYWQQYNKLRTALEEKFQGKVKRFFFEQRKLQLKLIADRLGAKAVKETPVDPDSLLFDLNEANQKLQKIIWPLYLNSAQEAGEAIYAELNFDISGFVVQDTEALEVLKTKLIKVTEINDLTRERIRETIAEGLANVESAGDLQQRIRDTFNFIESRSLTIARTETGQCMGAARDAAMDLLKVETIEWGTAGDGEVRDSHTDLSGVRRKRGQPFPNGCRYPCDPAGAAGEIINCRCVGIPVLGD